MTLRTLLVIKAIVCVIFAPLMLFVPEQLLDLFGAAYSTGAALTAREYGAALTGTAFLTWIARTDGASISRRAIIIAMFVYDLVALLACLYLMYIGALNALGWGVVIIYLFFTIAFGFFMRQREH